MDKAAFDRAAFAARLRELRAAAGLSPEDLAKLARLPLPTLRHYEQAQREPSFGRVIALADALGVSCDAFRPDGATAKKGKGKRPDG